MKTLGACAKPTAETTVAVTIVRSVAARHGPRRIQPFLSCFL